MKLLPCKCEENMMAQCIKISGEVEELRAAIAEYERVPTGKNRAEILFEALDVITATITLLCSEFMDEDIDAGIIHTNAKNFARGYLVEGGKFIRWMQSFLQK